MDAPELYADEIEQTLGYLHDGTTVTLVGPLSSGRSTVLRRIAERLTREGTRVVRIDGVRALADRPLGALSVAGVAPGPGSLQGLSSAVELLLSLLEEGPGVVLVDDADDLDPATAGVIVAACTRAGIPAVMSRRPLARRASGPGGSADGLVGGPPHLQLRPAASVTLGPLSFDRVHRLVHDTLNAPVDPDAVAQIAAWSGGLPGLVVAIVDAARRGKRLLPRRGFWTFRDELWTPALAQAVEPYLADLGEEMVDALTLLALRPQLPLEVARRHIHARTLTQLDDLGLVQVLTDGERAGLGIFPPLIAEYLRHEGALTRHLLAVETLGPGAGPDAGVGVGPGSDRDPDGSAVLLLDDGACTSAIYSRTVHAHWTDQLRAQRRAWEESPTPEHAATVLETMLTLRSRPHDVRRVIDGTRTGSGVVDGIGPAGPSGAAGSATTCAAGWAAVYEAMLTQSVDVGREALAAARGLAPGAAGALRAFDAYLTLQLEAVPDPDALVPAPDDDDLARDLLTVVRAESLVAAGRAEEALATLDGFRPRHRTVALGADLATGLALVYLCRFDEALDRARRRLRQARTALDVGAVSVHSYVAGLALAFQGRAVELEAVASASLALTGGSAHQPAIDVGIAALATEAARWQNRHDYAESLAAQSVGLPPAPGAHPYLVPEAIARLVEDGARPADALWDLAEERLEHGYVASGVVVGVASIERRADPARARRIAEAAAGSGAPLLQHLADYARTLATDPAGLAALEPRLRAAGMRLHAVRAAVSCAMELLSEGDREAAIERADEAWSRAGLRGRDLCGLFRPFDRAVSLSGRERQIAVLVAQGMSSPEIATRLVLSVRTVDNHVFSACRKLGLDSRDRLAKVARTWLSCQAF